MLRNYDLQMWSVLFRCHKWNENLFINLSLVHGCVPPLCSGNIYWAKMVWTSRDITYGKHWVVHVWADHHRPHVMHGIVMSLDGRSVVSVTQLSVVMNFNFIVFHYLVSEQAVLCNIVIVVHLRLNWRDDCEWVRCFIHRLISPMHQTWTLWCKSDASVKSTGE